MFSCLFWKFSTSILQICPCTIERNYKIINEEKEKEIVENKKLGKSIKIKVNCNYFC